MCSPGYPRHGGLYDTAKHDERDYQRDYDEASTTRRDFYYYAWPVCLLASLPHFCATNLPLELQFQLRHATPAVARPSLHLQHHLPNLVLPPARPLSGPTPSVAPAGTREALGSLRLLLYGTVPTVPYGAYTTVPRPPASAWCRILPLPSVRASVLPPVLSAL